MIYTISGKEYTKVQVDKRCAELMGIPIEEEIYLELNACWTVPINDGFRENYMPTSDAHDALHIIDKCWDELMTRVTTCGKKFVGREQNIIYGILWEYLMKNHNCTKLVAACICYIEINEAAL
jgi:hypothetical protein